MSLLDCAQCTTRLPQIKTSSPRHKRMQPLTIEEYELHYRTSASDLELIERVFAGSISCNRLRAALWPYLFGLTQHCGKFELNASETIATAPAVAGKSNSTSDDHHLYHCTNESKTPKYKYVEHSANIKTWRELKRLYETYQVQWRAIGPEQEKRFTVFRERKSLIERDVIRCDRMHPFYADSPQNLSKLNALLMTYMMYDFDIGYVQGMLDLAGPILYMYDGHVVKSFWVFVEVMKLFRRNFEPTQKTIHFQLNCLYELIKCTDPMFADYLEDNEASNCFFAFRAIVCQFKRELMRDDEDYFDKVLFLWDSIWCVARRSELQRSVGAHRRTKPTTNSSHINGHCNATQTTTNGHSITTAEAATATAPAISTSVKSGSVTMRASSDHSKQQSEEMDSTTTNNRFTALCETTRQCTFANTNGTSGNLETVPLSSSPLLLFNAQSHSQNQSQTTTCDDHANQSDTPRSSLTETEIFVLALCLSMIRRERDAITENKLDGTDIHLHFINPKLAQDLNNFIEQAINIYLFLKYDFDLRRLTSPRRRQTNRNNSALNNCDTAVNNFGSSPASADGFDSLSDFLIINGA